MKRRMLQDMLFIDIETVTGVSDYEQLSDRMKKLWRKKAQIIARNKELEEDEVVELYNNKAAIYAEFNKIVCISVGYLDFREEETVLKLKSFAEEDEKRLLEDFSELLEKHYNRPDKHYLCGHNIREFDCPVLCRRMIVNGLELPKLLRLSGKKPWQVQHIIDTLEMWKFGDYKNYISLDLLSAVLDIPSPKDDIDGSMVSNVYWEDCDLDRIQHYCCQDVATTASVFLKLIGETPYDFFTETS